MNERYLIFQKHEDYFNWEKQIQAIDLENELSNQLRVKTINSFNTLDKIFGKKYYQETELLGTTFSSQLINSAPWSKEWIIWFAKSLDKLTDQSNFDSLLKRIKKRESFEEGLSVLEIASKFHGDNFLIDFDPNVLANGKHKQPDLMVTSRQTDERFYVEVSILDKSDKLSNHQKITETIRWKFPWINFSGRLLSNLTNLQLRNLITEIEEQSKNILEKRELTVIYHYGIIELALAYLDDISIQEWATSKNLKVGSFVLPFDNIDPVRRLNLKIQTKQKQLPEDLPNILAIKMNQSQSLFTDKLSLIKSVQESVDNYNHLFAAIIYDHHIGSFDELVLTEGLNSFRSKLINEVEVENTFVILNRFSKIKMSQLLLSNLKQTIF